MDWDKWDRWWDKCPENNQIDACKGSEIATRSNQGVGTDGSLLKDRWMAEK